jgi:hypothetical protein
MMHVQKRGCAQDAAYPAALLAESEPRVRQCEERKMAKRDADIAERFGAMIEESARRGVFSSYSRAQGGKSGKKIYEVAWHKGRIFQLSLNPSKRVISIPNLLPSLERNSNLYKSLIQFVNDFAADDRPDHRRVSPERAYLKLSIRRGSTQLSIFSTDDDMEYAFKKIVQVVNEIFLLFMISGEYFAYRVEHLGADPDWGF